MTSDQLPKAHPDAGAVPAPTEQNASEDPRAFEGLFPEPPHQSRSEFVPYPEGAHQCANGRRIWELHEEGEELLVEGHGPAARVALADFLVERHHEARTYAEARVEVADAAGVLDEHHVAFLTSCGCTAHDHVKHVKLARLRGMDPGDVQMEVCEARCPASGVLPPCAPDEAPGGWWLPSWVACTVPPTDPRALPVVGALLDNL